MPEKQLNIIVTDSDLANAHGTIPVSMTNDYHFRALMQSNNYVLQSFICSLLHLNPNDVNSVTILNPIELGKSIGNKKYILDIKVELNGHSIINIEMQVVNEGNWPERSLCYLCRAFDNLNRGEDYDNVRPAIQIGILDFTLFEDSPEFFASYYLTNIKNHRIYSGKFRLSVLDLTQIDLATDEDKEYHIDQWAALFKATTWEEIKMLAQNNSAIKEAVRTVYQLTLDEKIRQQCEAIDDFYKGTYAREKLLEKTIQERDLAIAENELLRNLLREHGINVNET